MNPLAAPAAVIDAREREDAATLLRKYKKLCVEIGRGDGYHLDRIERAISALASRSEAPAARPNAAGQEQGWMPIATAPKDGTCVLVNDTSGLFADYCMAKWLDGDEWKGWVYDDEATADNNPLGPQPTHYMLIGTIPATPPLEAVGSSGMTADHAQGDKS